LQVDSCSGLVGCLHHMPSASVKVLTYICLFWQCTISYRDRASVTSMGWMRLIERPGFTACMLSKVSRSHSHAHSACHALCHACMYNCIHPCQGSCAAGCSTQVVAARDYDMHAAAATAVVVVVVATAYLRTCMLLLQLQVLQRVAINRMLGMWNACPCLLQSLSVTLSAAVCF